jgi:hypothetical protein
MAKDKKSFLLYCDVDATVQELTDKEAGQLFKHVLAFVNDRNPIAPNKIVAIAFRPIEQSLKRDLVKYETIKHKRSLAGQASAEAKKTAKEQQNLTNSTSVESVGDGLTKSTVSDSGSVSVSDRVIKDNLFPAPEAEQKVLLWYIGNEMHTKLPSEVVMMAHQNYTEQRVYGTGLSVKQVLDRLDKDYKGDSFSNTQHFRNTIKVIIDKLTKEKNGTNQSSFGGNRPGPTPGNLHSGRKDFGS